MHRIRIFGGCCSIALAFLWLTGHAVNTSAQSNSPGARFSAVAMDVDRAAATPIEVLIERWSSEAQRDRLIATLLERGPDKLLDALQSAPKVGYIRTQTSLAWDLHYARRSPAQDGGEQIVIATDRPISFWEQVNQPRTFDYPFTIVELHVDRDGEGTGMLSIAAKIIANKTTNTISIENYGTQPVRLTQVKAEKLS